MNVSKEQSKQRWTLRLMHVAFALLTPLLLFWMVGCLGQDGPENVDYGPEASNADVNTALSNLIRDSDPTQTQPGAYVHFATSDDVSEGEMNIVMADTFQQVTARNETAATVVYDLLETKASYHQSEDAASTLTRGFTLAFAKADPTSQAQPDLVPLVKAALATSAQMKEHIYAMARAARDDSMARTTDSNTPAPSPTATPDPSATRVTFHRLTTWEDVGPAPAAVAARPNCLGLKNCQLTLRHVTFDMVVWSDARGEPMHFSFVTSPQVPQTTGYQMSPMQNFFPGLLKSCLSQLVPVTSGSQTLNTLINECQEVQDFIFAGTTSPAD